VGNGTRNFTGPAADAFLRIALDKRAGLFRSQFTLLCKDRRPLQFE